MFDRLKNTVEKASGGRLHRSHMIAIGTAIAIILWFATGLFNGDGNNGPELTAAEQERLFAEFVVKTAEPLVLEQVVDALAPFAAEVEVAFFDHDRFVKLQMAVVALYLRQSRIFLPHGFFGCGRRAR